MDALTAFGVNWKLLVIQGVNFGLLLALLYRYLYKPLFAMLEKRQQAIADGLRDAELAKSEMTRVGAETQVLLRKAREDGGKLVDTLHKQGIEEERRIIREAQEKSAALLSEAQILAKEEQAHMLRESEKEIAKMAILGAEKILRASAAKN